MDFDVALIYEALLESVDALLRPFPGSSSESVYHYFEQRAGHAGARRKDLLPLFSFEALGGDNREQAMKITTAWALALAGAHQFDAVQDRADIASLNAGVVALGCANIALAQLEVNSETHRDLLASMGQITILGANAQAAEIDHSVIRNRQSYLTNIAGKAASLIAAGVWLGARLATDDVEQLETLKRFGLALGMAMQLSDDCIDLREDLIAGLITLPVIEGLSMNEHPKHAALERVIRRRDLDETGVDVVVNALERMGTIDKVRRLARAYQIQAMAAFDVFPGLKIHFSHNVDH